MFALASKKSGDPHKNILILEALAAQYRASGSGNP